MRHFLLIILTTFFAHYTFAQGVTRNGEITNNGSEYVNKNGAIGGATGADRYGRIVTAVSLPELTTTEITAIAATSAASGGDVTNTGGGTISARGVCWATSSGPTISSSKTTDGTGSGSFTSTLTGLSELTTYYVRAYATNSAGTAYGTEISFTTPSAIKIGDDYEGGKVAYIFESGDLGYVQGEVHGLIANLNDLSGDWWGATNWDVPGTSASIGSGNANTEKIVAVNGTMGVAYKCANLTSGGKSDWYLPSSQEAAKLYLNKTVLGLSDANYWTSTQVNTQYAYSIAMQNGVVSSSYKTMNYLVRPVRTF